MFLTRLGLKESKPDLVLYIFGNSLSDSRESPTQIIGFGADLAFESTLDHHMPFLTYA
jgi:hypothetical protein